MKHDPQDRDPKKRKLIKAAEMEQDGTIQLDGACHILWGRQ